MWIYLKVFLLYTKCSKVHRLKNISGAFLYKEVISLGLTLVFIPSVYETIKKKISQARPLSLVVTSCTAAIVFSLFEELLCC